MQNEDEQSRREPDPIAHAKSSDDERAPALQSPRVRRSIILWYWVVLLACVPYWWFSTTIERHALPLPEMEGWSDTGPCPVKLPLRVSLQGHRLSQTDKEQLRDAASSRCLDLELTAHVKSGQTFFVGSESSSQVEYTSATEAHLPPQADVAQAIAAALGLEIQAASALSKQTRQSVKYSSKYKLVFSLLNEDLAKGGSRTWEVDAALTNHVTPLLHTLGDLHHFDVESQVQYYAPLTITRSQTEDGQYVIEEDQLKVFVNSAEWNLASAVSSDPVLHFILYIPANDSISLLVRREDGALSPLQSFSIPQWGGIFVHPPGAARLSHADLAAPFRAFSNQLRAQLAIPSLPGQPSVHKTQWEVQALMRARTIQNARDTAHKLGAIARQVKDLQNMRIPKAVQEDVRGALDALAQVNSPLPTEAVRQSAIALNLATRASFNHEMLAMLYFPDEHKWAVYTPLFGPLAVPLLVALIREFKEWKAAKRANLGSKRKTE